MSEQAVTPELLVRELGKVSQWDVLGTYLGLEESEIEEIERDHQHTARRRIVMIRSGLKKTAPCFLPRRMGVFFKPSNHDYSPAVCW